MQHFLFFKVPEIRNGNVDGSSLKSKLLISLAAMQNKQTYST